MVSTKSFEQAEKRSGSTHYKDVTNHLMPWMNYSVVAVREGETKKSSTQQHKSRRLQSSGWDSS